MCLCHGIRAGCVMRYPMGLAKHALSQHALSNALCMVHLVPCLASGMKPVSCKVR